MWMGALLPEAEAVPVKGERLKGPRLLLEERRWRCHSAVPLEGLD